jgi:hypothetical protein
MKSRDVAMMRALQRALTHAVQTGKPATATSSYVDGYTKVFGTEGRPKPSVTVRVSPEGRILSATNRYYSPWRGLTRESLKTGQKTQTTLLDYFSRGQPKGPTKSLRAGGR